MNVSSGEHSRMNTENKDLWVGHVPLRIRKEAAMVGSGFSFLWVWKENFFPWWPISWVFIALCFWYLCVHAHMWACVFVCVHLCPHVYRGQGSTLVVVYLEVSSWFLSFFFYHSCWNLILLYRLIKRIEKRLSIVFCVLFLNQEQHTLVVLFSFETGSLTGF